MRKQRLGEKDIFNVARRISSPDARTEYLNQVCGDDELARQRVIDLLHVCELESGFLESPPPGIAAVAESSTPMGSSGTRIGPYELRRQIGEGGFGVVYLAEQHRPVRRKVALKLVKPGADTKSVVARFEAERQALALMDHPNIARVLDAGATDNGRPYFAMDLVKGVPITEYCDKHRLDTRERLWLFVQVCRAVQYAHQKGVIHRDLKPANIMVTLQEGKPVPKVIDFGVSKAIGQQLTEKTLYTSLGQIVGTPQYMSPEQAESGTDVDTRSDVYSLGVLLYELLTGQTPIEGSRLRTAGYAEIQRIIREDEPLKPSTRLSGLNQKLTIVADQRRIEAKKLRHLLRGDLDWIVMKAIEKDRARRYDSASRLADDIQRFLRDDAVEARPPSASYKIRKLVRRHKGPVIAVLAVSTALVAGIAGTSVGLVRARSAAAVARQLAGDAQDSEARANREAQRYRRLLYLSDMNAAPHAWQSGDAGRVADLLKRQLPRSGEEDLRRFEWYYLFALCQRMLKTPKVEGRANSVASSPRGQWLAFGEGHLVKLVDLQNGRNTTHVEHSTPVIDVAFSSQGDALASCTSAGEILLSDVKAQKQLRIRHGPQLRAIEYSPDGSILASCSWSQRSIKLWDVQTGGELIALQLDYPATSLAFSRDGTLLACCDWQGAVTLWNASSGQELHSLAGHSGPGTCVTFSPTEDRLASAGVDGTVKLWSAAGGTLKALEPMAGHVGVECLAFSPDGRKLASGGKDSTIKLWDVATRQELDRFRGSSPIDELVFLADGEKLAAASRDGIRIWDAMDRPTPDVLTGFSGEVCFAAFSPDGKSMVSGGWDGIVRIWDTSRWQVRHKLPHPAAVFCVALSPDGRVLATACQDKTIRLWDVANLNLNHAPVELHGHPGGVWSVLFSPDGQTLVSASDGGARFAEPFGTVKLWDLSSNTEIVDHPYDVLAGDARMAAYSPDGTWFASGSHVGTIRLWQAETGWNRILTTSALGMWYGEFSADGTKLLATAGRRVKLWDLASGSELTLDGDTALTTHAVFMPDGKTLAAAGYDGTVKLWDVTTGELQFTFPNQQTGINSFALSADGKTIALCCRNATIRLLRAASDEDVRVVVWQAGPN